MKIVSVIGQKGGTGKTTILLALATAAALGGARTAILDLDPQTTAENWHHRRKASTKKDDKPAVISVLPGNFKRAIETCRELDTELVFIDSPGHAYELASLAASVSDLVLVPTRTKIFDMETLETVHNVITGAGNPTAFIVLNGVHPNAVRRPKEASSAAQSFSGLPVAPCFITERNEYFLAPEEGKSPMETNPKGAAAKEIKELLSFVAQQLNTTAVKTKTSTPKPKARKA